MDFLAKRAVFMASKRCAQIQSSNGVRFSWPCFHNTAYEDQGLKGRTGERAAKYDHNVENMSGITGFAADAAVGAAKAAENAGEMVKETAEQAWDSTKNAARDVQDTAVASAEDNVVDTTEYRTIIDQRNADGDHREESEI